MDGSAGQGEAAPMAAYSDEKALRRKRFSLSLREARKAARMSQQDLADAITAELGDATIGQSAVSRWEIGTHLPERDRIPLLERILDVPPGTWVAMASGLEADTDDSPIEISAHGTDLEELRRRDPDTYELLIDMARRRLDQLDGGR